MNVTTNVDGSPDWLHIGLLEEDFFGALADEFEVTLREAAAIAEGFDVSVDVHEWIFSKKKIIFKIREGPRLINEESQPNLVIYHN